MDLIKILIIVLSIGYIFYIFIESILIRYYRKHIKYVIHVNGIRGKSSTTRLIDSGLRECGFKVLSKTTGTMPTIIDVNNNENIIKRIGNANIREQVRMLRLAYKQKVDVLVLECMAVNSDLQRVCEESILKSNIAIITNIREDHINEMGNNLDEIALALSNTIPSNGYLITVNSSYNDLLKERCDKKNSKLIISKPTSIDNVDSFDDNIGNAIEVAKILNLDMNKYLIGLSKFKKDIGQLCLYKYKDSIFINGLSINDIDSIKIVYDLLKTKYDLNNLVILLNNREDRPSRLISLLNIFDYIDSKEIILTGSNIGYCKNKLKRKYKDLKIHTIKNIDELLNYKLILGIGNIKGIGLDILEFYKKGEVI